MEALKVVLIVLFVIISILLVLLVLIQNEDGGGMGGLLSGAGSAAFGAHSPSVINKTTFVLVILFFVTAFSIARLNKAPALKEVNIEESTTQDVNSENEASDWWNDVPATSVGEPSESSLNSDAQ